MAGLSLLKQIGLSGYSKCLTQSFFYTYSLFTLAQIGWKFLTCSFSWWICFFWHRENSTRTRTKPGESVQSVCWWECFRGRRATCKHRKLMLYSELVENTENVTKSFACFLGTISCKIIREVYRMILRGHLKCCMPPLFNGVFTLPHRAMQQPGPCSRKLPTEQ